MLENKRNTYDNLIVLYIVLQVFGVFGDALQPIRLFIIVCILPMLTFYLHHKSVVKHYKYELVMFFIWVVYGVISLLWVYAPNESIKEIIYLIVQFSGFFLLLFFSNKAMQPKESIIKGWILLFVLTIPVALVEFLFDQHLSFAVQTADAYIRYDGIAFQRRFASVTFGNLNGYNTMLAYILPFLMGSLLTNNTSSKLSKTAGMALFIVLCYFIVINSSRGALICLLLGLFVFLTYRIKNIASLVGIGGLIAIGIGFLLFSNNEYMNLIFERFLYQGLGDEGRESLLGSGITSFIKSGFMGVGAGDFMPTMKNEYFLDNISPHNFFLEVVVQYGIIIFALFIGFFIRIIKKNKENIGKRYKYIVISSLVIYPFLSIIDSSYLLNMSTWLFLASIYVIADNKYTYS